MTPLSLPLHSYLRLRTRLAYHAMRHFAVSLTHSLEFILLGFGPVMLGLIACLALPGLFAATLPWPQALAVLAAQTLLICAPVLLLRKRLHPAPVLAWSRALPLSRRLCWQADALVAAMVAGPLALAYALSCAIWWYQWPEWLRPVAPLGLGLTALSLLAGWLLSTALLAWRARRPAARKPGRTRPTPAAYVPGRIGAVGAFGMVGMVGMAGFWRQLFWLPFWRAENMVGVQQTCLLLGAVASVGVWIWRPPLLPPALWGACAALLLVLLTDRGDKAVAEQIALLGPALADWPFNAPRLFNYAMLFTLLPGVAVMLWFAALTLGKQNSGYGNTVAVVWLCFAAIAQIAIVSLRRLSARGRVGLVIGAILILTAIGSELWN